jgi:hypothetical protein
MFWIQYLVFERPKFHTQLMFWIQNLVFEGPKFIFIPSLCFESKTWFFRDQNLFSYPAYVLDPKPNFLETKIYFHTQLMFWIQNLVFERPKLEKFTAQKSIIDFHQTPGEAFIPRHSSSNVLFLTFSCCLIVPRRLFIPALQ